MLISVQFRPPKIGTMNEYTMRSVAPDSPGSAASQKSWLFENPSCKLTMIAATTLKTCHTEKARNSA